MADSEAIISGYENTPPPKVLFWDGFATLGKIVHNGRYDKYSPLRASFVSGSKKPPKSIY